MDLGLGSAAGFALDPAGPKEEAEKLPALRPEETDDVAKAKLVCPHAGVGFHAPPQVLTSPWGEARTARRVPEKSNRCEHWESYAALWRRLLRFGADLDPV